MDTMVKEMIMKNLFEDELWDPYLLFPEKFIGTDEPEDEIIARITFEEYKKKFLEAIDKGKISWEDFCIF